MKILFNCLSMERGGAERVISVLANNFIENNEITIVTLLKGEAKYELNENVKLINIDKYSSNNINKVRKIMLKISPRRLFGLAKIIKKEKPDVIISFLPEPSLRLMFIKKINKTIRKIPTIISIRNDPKIEYSNKIIYYVMKKLYKNVDSMVLQTEDAKNYFKDIIKDNNKLEIIPNPINSQFVVNSPFDGERDKTIVTVGRLEKQKNHKLLIDSFKKVLEKHDDYNLLIYGKGNLKTDLEEYVNKLEISDKVIFKGQVDNVKQEIYNAGIFVLSSDYEGMPNALMEAMSLGLPCISTDCPCGGPKTLINNEENGILVEVNNETDMANAINLLIENKDLAKKISCSANRINDTYSIEKISNKWMNIIERMV